MVTFYDLRCTLTGNQVRFVHESKNALEISGGEGEESIRILLKHSVKRLEEVKVKDGEASSIVVKKRTHTEVLDLSVDVDLVDFVAYLYCSILRWRFVATCPAKNVNGEKMYIVFRSLPPQKYLGHCLLVTIVDTGDGNSGKKKVQRGAFFLTPSDVIRIRDIFHNALLRHQGMAVIDSIVITHTRQTPRIRVSGGSEVFLTKLACERILYGINQIITAALSGKKWKIGVVHGAVSINNSVTKSFAVANFSVAGWSIPLDYLNTIRLFVHLSVASQRIPDSTPLFSFSEEDGEEAKSYDRGEILEAEEEEENAGIGS